VCVLEDGCCKVMMKLLLLRWWLLKFGKGLSMIITRYVTAWLVGVTWVKETENDKMVIESCEGRMVGDIDF
jgi:hypothetical protein